jgi:multidrug efflux pump subunit AcrA (membrane-fusion protein)
MSRNQKIIAAVVVAVLVVTGVVIWATSSGSKSKSNSSAVVIYSRVQRRTLQNTVALTGTLARKQLRNITASTQGIVSAVHASNGSVGKAGQSLFALNGRPALAETGTVAFFRSLEVGDQGDDVTQLKKILTAAGDYPGPMNNQFTLQTQFALAQWQAQHHYPNSTPATPESVTVAMAQGSGYKLGDSTSAGLIIGPPTATAADVTTSGNGTPAHAVLDSMTEQPSRGAHLATPNVPTPVVTIQSVDSVIPQGEPATFVVQASATSASALTINLSEGGTATGSDVVTPPTAVTLPAGATSTTVAVQTRLNNTVESEPTLIMSVSGGSGYTVGSPSSAQTTITNNNVPTLQITGATTVTAGSSATLTVTANQAPLQNIQVVLQLSGSAMEGTDYNPVNPVLQLNAGSTTTSVVISTIAQSSIAPSKFIVASLSPSPQSYSVGNQASAVVTIAGSGALPVATLTSATTYLAKGEPYQVAISLNQATTRSVTVALSYSGTARLGTDYTEPAGTLTIPAGQTALAVTIPTVTDNTVESDKTLTVTLAPGSGYTVGQPNSASVTIDSDVVPTLNLTASANSVSQGGAASFTITADQAPVKATSINFTATSSTEPGVSFLPITGSALLAAGQTSVTVQIQTLQTNISFEPTDMIVGSWPTRIGTVYVKAGNPIAPGGPILSLTEPTLSVTLQASAANRSNLKVGQKATVQIDGDNNTYAGTITELDSSPTSVSSGAGASAQVYEGRIEVPNITGADGSQVSITVIDQQELNALTVPIAAVKQNGSGASVVRVVDLRSGQITEVPVTTGLTEGSYIEVTKGLHPNEVVVVQVNQSS